MYKKRNKILKNVYICNTWRCSMKQEKGNVFVTLFLRGCLGLGCIYFINIYLEGNGIIAQVGLNAITAVTSAALGLPGVGLLYGVTFFQIL